MADEIRTARLILRRPTMADAPVLHRRLYSDPEVMRYGSRLPDKDVAQTAEFLAKAIATNESGESDDFVILLGGEIVGKCGLWRGNEIGFQIAREHWGKGLVREAAEAVLARARTRGFGSVTADVDPRNTRSLALLARLGFAVTGEKKNTFQLGDEWTDSVYLAKTL
jgi:ribosomal-protein-alanine N-acetyltransferase